MNDLEPLNDDDQEPEHAYWSPEAENKRRLDFFNWRETQLRRESKARDFMEDND